MHVYRYIHVYAAIYMYIADAIVLIIMTMLVYKHNWTNVWIFSKEES